MNELSEPFIKSFVTGRVTAAAKISAAKIDRAAVRLFAPETEKT